MYDEIQKLKKYKYIYYNIKFKKQEIAFCNLRNI